MVQRCVSPRQKYYTPGKEVISRKGSRQIFVSADDFRAGAGAFTYAMALDGRGDEEKNLIKSRDPQMLRGLMR
jgi:hypothetical protein